MMNMEATRAIIAGSSDYKRLAVSAAQRAGGYLKNNLHARHLVRFKGEIDIVTEADQQAESMIIAAIHEQYPDHDILAEESSATHNGSLYRWIIDPLDGTTNYAHGYPVFCVSIALEWKGVCILGVVFSPMLEEMFVAVKGQGAFLNDKPIAVSRTTELSRSLLATGFPYDIRLTKENNMNHFEAMAVKAQAIRRAGSAALDLAYVAAGRFDGFWELKLNPWDTAAGCLLVEEAGGVVTDLHGEAFTLTIPHVVASNGRIHRQILSVLNGST
jgi:myo-inositol-1(or 4)-monophosphatase